MIVSKITIVEQEADESQFWLEMTAESNTSIRELVTSLHREASELTAILVASGKTAKQNSRHT